MRFMIRENFSGYVLAGGKSSRMRKNKAFLEIGGETFLERAVNTLSETCENPIRIVLKQPQYYMADRFPGNAEAIYDVSDFDSPLDGLHRAFMDCSMRKKKYAVVLAVDLPNVTGEVIKHLAEIAESSNRFLAVVPRQTDGRVQPLCAVYNAGYCHQAISRFLSENSNASIKSFLETISTRFIDQKKLPNNEAGDIFFNVNYPADFASVSSSDK